MSRYSTLWSGVGVPRYLVPHRPEAPTPPASYEQQMLTAVSHTKENQLSHLKSCHLSSKPAPSDWWLREYTGPEPLSPFGTLINAHPNPRASNFRLRPPLQFSFSTPLETWFPKTLPNNTHATNHCLRVSIYDTSLPLLLLSIVLGLNHPNTELVV